MSVCTSRVSGTAGSLSAKGREVSNYEKHFAKCQSHLTVHESKC